MRPARLLLVIAVAVFLLAAAVWVMGNQWAERTCLESGTGRDLLGRFEGRLVVEDGQCVATGHDGRRVVVPLADWSWDAAALVVAGVGMLLLGVAGYASRRLASRSDG